MLRSPDDLRPYQRRMVDWITATPYCANWVFMGAGKTVSTLTAFQALRQQFDAQRLLVIAPLRVARTVWSDEIRQWGHLQGLTVSRVLGTQGQRRAALAAKADVYTMNRENVAWLEEQFIVGKKQVRPWPFDMVVLDESQSYKAQSSRRFKSLRRLRRLIPRLVELTGTPSPNGLADLWAQMFLLDRGQRLGLTETAYRERWFDPPGYGEFKWTPKDHADREIHEALADIVLSLRESDYFDLPPVMPQFVKVQLPREALAQYKRFERTFIMQTYEGRTVTAVSAGVCVGKRMQLANGSIYVDDAGTFEEFHTEKLDALVELLDGISTPVIVAYAFRADFERIRKRLADEHGSTRRVEWLDSPETEAAWNRGEIDVLLLHPESAGHGLNLQHAGAEDLIWFGLTYNLEHIQQTFARLGGGHRRGKVLRLWYIVAEDTIDAEVLAALDNKALTQETLVNAVATLAKDQQGSKG